MAKHMTRRERLMAIFEGRIPDRPAVRVWGLDFYWDLIHPAFGPIREKAFAITDVITESKAPFDLFCGVHSLKLTKTWEEKTASSEWVDEITTIQTPKGVLRQVYQKSTLNKPGYHKEHFVKDAADVEKLLSLPYEAFPCTADDYLRDTAKMGDDGIVIQGIDNPAFGLHRLMGSETIAYLSVDNRDLLMALAGRFARRVREHVNQVLATGIRPVFGWVGPEIAIPPLMSVNDFEEIVFQNDKNTIDVIHNAGCRLWVHCHGDMSPVLERFADMGVDVLNPIEPPPTGRITLEQAFARVGNRMGLEGNIEVHDVMTLSREALGKKIEEAVRAGAGKRYILGMCSGYMEDPFPTPRLIENLMFFVEEGVRLAEACRRG